MIRGRHAAAAIESGLCNTVLITHGESGSSGSGAPQCRRTDEPRRPVRAALWPPGDRPLRAVPGAPTLFTIPVLRYMKTYGLTDETLAMVSVAQREWAAKNPRATFKTPITVEDV